MSAAKESADLFNPARQYAMRHEDCFDCGLLHAALLFFMVQTMPMPAHWHAIGTTYRAAIGNLCYSLFAALIYCELGSEGSFGDNDVGVTLADADTEIFRTSPGISGVVSVACSVMAPSLVWRTIS